MPRQQSDATRLREEIRIRHDLERQPHEVARQRNAALAVSSTLSAYVEAIAAGKYKGSEQIAAQHALEAAKRIAR